MTKKNSSKKVDIWLIGPGYMGIEYAKVLMALDLTFKVIGRSNKNKISFYKETGHIVEKNNLESCIKNFDLPDKVIVATNIENIIEITKKLIKRGVKNILIEKPGSLIKKELMSIKYNASKINSNIYIAYNRRFYESVIEAKKIINKDKGILSTFFNFTEISEQIKNISFPKKIKNRWLIANSSHVIDLVFHLCGKPKNLTSITEGNIDWHPSSSIFVGSGKTEKGVLFSYSSNWQSPGRWYIEIE